MASGASRSSSWNHRGAGCDESRTSGSEGEGGPATVCSTLTPTARERMSILSKSETPILFKPMKTKTTDLLSAAPADRFDDIRQRIANYQKQSKQLPKAAPDPETKVRRVEAESIAVVTESSPQKSQADDGPKASAPVASPARKRTPKLASPTQVEPPAASPTLATPASVSGAEEQRVKLSAISFEEELQIRVVISKVTVADYAERMSEGERFPPVQLFIEEDRYYIGDGWHRLRAAQTLGYATFPAVVNTGGRRAALRFSLSANATHGLPRTNEDKLRAISIAITEYPYFSNREVGRICAVSEAFVRMQRGRCERNAPEKRLGADGKLYGASKSSKIHHDEATQKAVLEAKVKRACTVISELPPASLFVVKEKIDERIAMLEGTKTNAAAQKPAA
jgi:hypothetical protein